MSLNMTMDETAGQRGFTGRKGTSVKVTHSPGGECSINIFQPDGPADVAKPTISPCQVKRNESNVFNTTPSKPEPAEQNTSQPSEPANQNLQDVSFRPSTKVRNPPGGVSSISFG